MRILYHMLSRGTLFIDMKRRRRSRRYRFKNVTVEGKDFRVQGYEPFFLAQLSEFGLKAVDVIAPGPPVRYKIGRRWHTYTPDFYIPKLNTLVEIKSPYTMGKAKRKNQAKWSWARMSGYTMLVLVYDGKGRRV
jgi:hypothetical protein